MRLIEIRENEADELIRKKGEKGVGLGVVAYHVIQRSWTSSHSSGFIKT